jgi:putative two-component system response regulator
LAGRLHDVGKIGTRESVLNKPDALTPEEYDHVKEHVRIGMEILAPLKHLGPALAFVHDHHERWDGGGYPRGLRGEEISLGGRILAAADAFDALTSRRAYREPMEPQATLEFLKDHVGKLLDPQVYAALCSVVGRRQTLTFIDS